MSWLPRQTLPRHLVVAVFWGVVLFLLTTWLSGFRDYQIANIAFYVVGVAGLTVLVGLSGQISIGNGAFMAVGAYIAALVLRDLGWPLAAVFVASAVFTALAGAVVGVAAARLHGPYLAGATLMFAVALPALATHYSDVFGGDQGLTVTITTPSSLGLSFPLTRWQAWITCLAALITLVLLANLTRSRVGRTWRAVRDDEVAAALAGIDVARARVLAFVVSAACAGLAGAMLAVTAGLVAPAGFTIALSIALLAGAVLGGLGSLAGAVWGSIVLVLLPTYVTNIANSHGLGSSVGSNIPIAVYGAVLIAVILVFPDGIQGGLRRLAALTGRVAARPLRHVPRAARRRPPNGGGSPPEASTESPPDEGRGHP
ncbi:MAG: branched-chain amino acid ABC transporter permease [Streptosporangiaceae bacterium]